MTLAALLGLVVSMVTSGCERTVSKTEETKVKDDGTVKSKEKAVTEAPNGTITRTETKTTSTNRP